MRIAQTWPKHVAVVKYRNFVFCNQRIDWALDMFVRQNSRNEKLGKIFMDYSNISKFYFSFLLFALKFILRNCKRVVLYLEF
jgi:hypothetical protein